MSTICWNEAKTVEHLCFTCAWMKLIEFGGCAGMRYNKKEICWNEEWPLKLFSGERMEGNIKAMIALTCWFIWKERCSVQIENKALDVNSVVRKIRYAFEEIQMVKWKGNDTISREVKEEEEIEDWKPLEE